MRILREGPATPKAMPPGINCTCQQCGSLLKSQKGEGVFVIYKGKNRRGNERIYQGWEVACPKCKHRIFIDSDPPHSAHPRWDIRDQLGLNE